MIGKILLASAIAVPVATTATVAATGVAWIDVKEGGRDGHRIVLPVPLLLAETAASFIPQKELDLNLPPEAVSHLAAAREVLQALAASPDGEYVRVEQEDERVLVEKRGDVLHVQVHGQRRRGREREPASLRGLRDHRPPRTPLPRAGGGPAATRPLLDPRRSPSRRRAREDHGLLTLASATLPSE